MRLSFRLQRQLDLRFCYDNFLFQLDEYCFIASVIHAAHLLWGVSIFSYFDVVSFAV
jgi:hypothetical protein